MGMQNSLRGTRIHRGHAERALRQSFYTDWSCTPSFLWYHFDTGTFPTMPTRVNARAVTRTELLPSRPREWKEVYVDKSYPIGYLEEDFGAYESISRGPSLVGWAPGPAPMPSVPLAPTAVRLVPALTPSSVRLLSVNGSRGVRKTMGSAHCRLWNRPLRPCVQIVRAYGKENLNRWKRPS